MSSSDLDLLLSDVRTIELALEGHALRTGVGALARFGDAAAARDHVHDPTATHDEAALRVALGRSMEREYVLGQAFESGDRHPGLRRPRIVLGTEDDVDVRTVAEANRLSGNVLREAPLTEREEELREIALDPRERDLCLRIAEASVVLEHLPAARGLHEPRVENTAIRRSALHQRPRDGRADLVGDGLRLVVRQDGGRRGRAHAG